MLSMVLGRTRLHFASFCGTQTELRCKRKKKERERETGKPKTSAAEIFFLPMNVENTHNDV